MKKFTILSGPAAALPMINIDTDQIIPKQYLSAITRAGLGNGLFHDFRYKADNSINADFVLNREPYDKAQLLITGDNFGCGSSREHAPWSLDDFGIRCVIAPSFADIFFGNCLKNGILLIKMPESELDQLMKLANEPETCLMTVNLENQNIQLANGNNVNFEIESFRKHRLLNGLDDIEMTLQHIGKIESFEAQQKINQPWLYKKTTV